MAYLRSHERTASLPVGLQTAAGSAVAAIARVALTPLDVAKTILQVHGRKGWPLLGRKVRDGGVQGLFSGAFAASFAAIVSHLPWFYVVRICSDLSDEKWPAAQLCVQRDAVYTRKRDLASRIEAV